MAQNQQVKNEPIKEVQIKPEFLCNIRSSKRTTVKSKHSSNPNLKPNKLNLKKALLDKIRQHRINSITSSNNTNIPNLNDNKPQIVKSQQESIVKSPTIGSGETETNERLDKFKNDCNFLENLSKKKQGKEPLGGNILVDTSSLPLIRQQTKLECPTTDLQEKIDNGSEPPNEQNEKHARDPQYSCMKNGSKPTYREWKRTQKNNSKTNDAKLILGKKGRKVGILVKNSDTRKMISAEHMRLKQVKVSSMKNYLKKHNLLRSGSYAPNEIIKKMYEQSLLAGEVNNSNSTNIVENYLV